MSREPIDQFIARYFPEGFDALDLFHRELQARMPDAGTVLDLGCGANRELARYRTPSRQVWGVDFQVHPDTADPDWFRLQRPDGPVPFPDDSFDLIASCWVLEHVREPGPFLAEVSRLLRPGGTFVALSINAWHYVTWLARLVSALPHWFTQTVVHRLYGRAPHDTFPTCYRMNTAAGLRRQARRSGLEFAGLRRVANPGYLAFSPALQRLAVRFDRLLDRVAPDLGRIYFVVTLRKPGETAPALPARRAA
jgi:SAM-dependent methyltransferase